MQRRLIAVSLLALTLASCASGSKNSSSPGTKTPATIRIAIAAPLGGTYEAYGKPIQVGEQIAVDQINASGGIPSGRYKGAKLEIVAYDDQLDPKQDADAAQKVVDDPSIWAYTGLASSDGALAARPILERGQVALIASYASSPQITAGSTSAFIIASPHGAYAYSGVQAAKDAGAQKIAIVAITGAFGDSISRLSQQAAKNKGLTVTTVQTMNSGDTNVATQVLKAKRSGADTLLTVGYAGDVIAVNTAAKKASWSPRLIDAGGGAFDPSVLKSGASEGLTGVVDYDAASTDPANQALVEAYLKAAGSRDVPPPAAHGYETIQVIVKALEQSPKNRAGLAAALRGVSLDNTGVGKLRFDAGGNPIDRPMWIFSIKSGAFVFSHGYVYDGKDVTRLELRRG